MNKEVIKAINKKETIFTKIHKWWRKNDYKIYRVIFFPLWIPLQITLIVKDKITIYLNSRQVWNEERASNILNYYIPRYCKWDKDKKEFYFFDNGYGWEMYFAKKILKRKDRRFWACNTLKIRRYLINTFELEGFTKEVLMDTEWTEIVFTMNESA